MADLQIIPAGKKVEAQYVEMKVPLYSFGCEKKVKKTLSHLRGIHSVDVDYNLQKVTVWGICNKYDVLATIRKKRRGARFWDQSDSDVAQQEIKVNGDQAEAEGFPQLRAVNSFKFKLRKPWKKLLPLLLYN